MKRTLLIVAAAVALVLTGCAEMGLDGSILERIEDIENRLDEVETLVNADKNGLTITSVQEVAEGYLIIFSDGSSVTVRHGKDGADGKDGQDGEDGEDGQDGENGSAGENGSNGSCIITSVEIGADSVTFNLSDGRTVVIPLQEGAVTPNAPSLTISFDYSHIDVVMPGKEYIIPYTVESNYDDITVEAFSGNSSLLIVSAIPDAEDNKKGTIHFVSEGMGGYDMPSELEQELLLNSKITVLATDGKSVVMRTLKFENGAIGTYDASDIIVSGEGEVVQLNFLTNVEYTVEFENAEWNGPADWLSLVETKALEEKTINVKVEKNDTGRCRRAYVNIYSQPYDTMWGDDERIGFSYEIYQNGTGEIEVNEITWTVGYEGGYFESYELPFELVSYGGYMYCEESCNWLRCSLYGYDGYFDYIEVYYNDTTEERTATITIQEEFYEYVYVYNEEYDYGYVEEQGNYKTTNVINVVQRPYGYVADASVIYYTSTDGNIVEPNDVTAFDANIVSNTYENGQGVITFDGEVTTIGRDAFWDCSSLASITIPDSVTSIGDYAFGFCTSLASITIPDSVTSIGDYAFCGCSSLASVSIGNGVTSIGDGAFAGCSSLEEFRGKFASSDGRCLIIDGVLNSFAPTGLTEYTIPEGVTSIGSSAFDGCSSLASITIPEGVTSIGDYAFYGCSSLATITIPQSVTSIGYYAFEHCSSLASVSIGNGVTSIGVEAFYNCSSLASVSIGNGVTSIGDYAFAYCYALENIDIPESVTEIHHGAFAASGLTSIDLPDNLTYLGNNAFAATALYDIDIPRSITTIPDELFFNCDNLTSVTIPSHVISIGVAVFASCDGLTSFYGNFASADGLFLVEDGVVKAYAAGYNGDFTFPSDVVAIGEGAFYNCGLQWINIVDNIHTIGPNALAYNPLGSANIASVKWIGEVAFQGCPYLPEITIPSSVEFIGYGAFAGCEGLTSVYCTGVTPADVSLTDDGEWLGFYNTPNLTAIYVPKSDVTTYKSALGWSEYADIIYDISFAPVSAPAKSSAMASGISAGMAGGKKVCDDRATSINPEARAQHTKGHRMGKDLLVKNFQR